MNKCSRTFAAQMEALKRHCSSGRQEITVQHQHVHVHGGGQAVVTGGSLPLRRGEEENSLGHLMNPVSRLRSAPRCTATSKRTRKPCKAPAVRGWSVCRFHGARGGAKGKRNGNWLHGMYSVEIVEHRRAVNQLLKAARASLAEHSME